ncbi:MAG: hypothetical protein CME68_11300 [Halobacteriovoraceae bacterium]|nr:hypothetical protein [Halobacteriovoraceae bacterium]
MKTLLVFALSFLVVGNLAASSRVIKDNRLNDRGRTPSLGRGYSVTTNTLQSLCYKNVDVTIPSYDLQYTFKDIEEGWQSSYSYDVSAKASYSYWFLSANVSSHSSGSGENQKFYHYIYAKIDLESYYNSLNEATSEMSDSAIQLLKEKDVVGFFDACGPYYVRSIGRHSSFLALLRYETESNKRDLTYEASLKAQLRGFGSSGSVEVDAKYSNSSEHQKKQLNITVWAQGLGKDKLASLLPTDIESFKKTVQDSILTMQDANTGIITSMEIVPWIENTDFQQYLKLEKEQERLKYKEKKTLMANSEIIAEIDRIDRGQMDNYYKMRNCQNAMLDQFPTKEQDPERGYDYSKTFIKDLAEPGNEKKEKTLAELKEIVSDDAQKGILDTNDAFIEKATQCVDLIHENGIERTHYRQHPACLEVKKEVVLPYLVLDHFCMPEFSRMTK